MQTLPENAASSQPRARPSATSRFFRAMGFPWKGMGFVVEHPRLLPLVLAPMAVAVAVSVGILGGAWHYGSALAHRWAGDGVLGTILFVLILLFVVFALGYVGFVAILSIANAPFCAALSERVESIATGRPLPKQSIGVILLEALRGLGHALLRVLAYAAVSVPIYLLGLVVPPLSPVLVILGMIVTCYFLAYDYLDYPLSTRRSSFGQKWAFIGRYTAESLGFGAMAGLIMAIPGVNLLMAPFCAVGAALLYVELEPHA